MAASRVLRWRNTEIPESLATVTVLYKTLPQYRVAFFQGLRVALGDQGVRLRVLYGDPRGEYALRKDTAELSWGEYQPNAYFSLGGRELIWQSPRDSLADDLVIVEQASRLLSNYVLLAAQVARRTRVAFWGHGANLQAHHANRLGETIKRIASRAPHWWFAYTEGAKERVMTLGFPSERITVVQNSIDSLALATAVARVTDNDRLLYRRRHGLGDGPQALFIGSLHPDKRIAFALEAMTLARQRIPDLEFVVAGAGPEERIVRAASAAHSWVHYIGPQFDLDEKAVTLREASIVVMPGMVGLGIIDAFAAMSPPVVAGVNFHSPEIEYLRPNQNGLLTPEDNTESFAVAVVSAITNGPLRATLLDGCRQAAATYTNEAMVSRFSAGVMRALKP